MTSAAPTTSVVVSTYDEKRWEDLVACLESLARQTRAPLEVIVVADHNDALRERVAERFAEVRAIANGHPRGLAGARNAGIEVARGEVVAFIDDDARAEPAWLAELEKPFADPAVVGAGGALLPLWQGHVAHWMPPEFYWVVGCSYAGLPADGGPVRNPIGANMAVRKAVLEEVGGFREGDSTDAPRELRARGMVRAANNVPDDTDLAIRVNQAHPGAVWMYEPRARVQHSVTDERSRPGYYVRRCWEEGIGKASLTGLVGAGDGLASERRHAAVALPRGVLRELGALLRGDGAAALRILAIVGGLAITAAGYLSVRLRAAMPRPLAILLGVRSEGSR
ncbi:MAG TPA: glycosyltransferase family 2 protein [Solirubrobacterales bacterium]|nr:glycosyltransferase family 2 protein [Solirubrobacterales bacterium]